MKAGRELDARIETEVFGNEVVERMCLQSYDCGKWEDAEEWYEGKLKEIPEMRILPCVHDRIEYVPIVHYSTQMADAWRVVEKMWNVGCWRVDIRRMDNGYLVDFDDMRDTYSASATAAPLAICLAALAVVERREG